MNTTTNSDTISLTYPGGKGNLYQRLISLIPPHRVYVEPFAGGGAVARMKRPARVNIAIDADTEALAALRSIIVRNGVGCPGGLAKDGDTAGGRIAKNGERGRRHRRGGEAARWQFLNTDALAWLAAYDWRGDEFVYADPPYLRYTRKQARALYRHEMTNGQHRQLLSVLTGLPCPVMISGYHSEMYAQALAGWHVQTFDVLTRGGSPATEYVWMNYPAPVALHDYRYLGDGFRERERIKRKKRRWVEKLRNMPILEKQAILAAIAEMEESNGYTTEYLTNG